MFDSRQTSSITRYTVTTALVIVSYVFSFSLPFVSRPFEYMTYTLGSACGVLGSALAWANWKRYSQLTVPAMAI